MAFAGTAEEIFFYNYRLLENNYGFERKKKKRSICSKKKTKINYLDHYVSKMAKKSRSTIFWIHYIDLN